MTGSVAIKSSAGRTKYLRAVYTGTTDSNLFLQIHNAANTGSISSGTLVESGWELDTTNSDLTLEFLDAVALSSGFCVAFSTTQHTYMAAGSETAYLSARYK